MGDVQMSLFGHLGGVMEEYERLSEILKSYPNLRWETAPMFDFGIIYGVDIWPLRKPSHIYLVCFCCGPLGTFWWFHSAEHKL
jgi:hypothetical protein